MFWTALLAVAAAQDAELVAHFPFDGSAEDLITGEFADADPQIQYGFGPIDDAVAIPAMGTVDVGPIAPDGVHTLAFFALWTGQPGQVYGCDAVRLPDMFVVVDTQIRIGGRLRAAASDRWHHIAVVWDGDQQLTYVDGVVDLPLDDAFDPTPVDDGACVFGDADPQSNLQLFVDDLRMYSGVLSAAEVSELVLQWDTDADGVGDVADNCPDEPNVDQADFDADGIGDACDLSPEGGDADEDGVPDPLDRCQGDDALGDVDNDRWCADLDCDDRDGTVHPNAVERCDGLDTDCDGTIPSDEVDNDGDGWLECGGDCDDGDRFINPDEDEVCDGVDNDCEGLTDPLFCDIDCSPSGCMCATTPAPVLGGWVGLLMLFASRRRRHK